MDISFGTAGNSDSFYAQGHKHSYEMPAWLKAMGLNAYEYSAGRGVRIRQETAEQIGREASANGVAISIHAPYYINFANPDPEKIENSVRHIVKSAQAIIWMGGKRVVFHPGSVKKGDDRKQAFDRIKQGIEKALIALEEKQLDVIICPETMGQISQIGDLEETIELCQMFPQMLPCIDFGHLQARSLGQVQGKQAFANVLDKLEQGLGDQRGCNFHSHFSRIEYTKAGEKKHWTYADTQYGPDFEPLAELLFERKLQPVIICESSGTMAEDAAKFKEIYENQGVLA